MSDDRLHLNPDHRGVLERHFDTAYYLAAYPDIEAAGIDPLLHYDSTGWHEGRNPSRSFNTLYYLFRYPDIAAAGMNPLLHFALAGETEGRVTMRSLDAWRRRLEALPSGPEQHADNTPRSDLLTEAALRAGLQPASAAARLIVSISHDDYAMSTGGIQNIIADEEAAAAQLGWRYLHISPVTHRSALSTETLATVYQVSLRLGRDWIGYATMATLLQTLGWLRALAGCVEVIIHHMMAHAPELLRAIVQAAGCERPLFWVHDFFTVCPSYTLMRNDVVFCGGPPQVSAACMICHYGSARAEHQRRVKAFFDAVKPTVLTPSWTTLEAWRQMAGLSGEAHVIPLGRLVLADSAEPWAPGTQARPLRIAHVGNRVFHKGWPVFEALSLRYRFDKRFTFFQIGGPVGEPLLDCIQHVNVNVTRDTRLAMIEALAELNIDVVVNWSLWPETFCFAAYEAVASGAFVIANAQAGNVPRMLAEDAPEQSLILADCEALFALFDGDALLDNVLQSRRRRGALMLGTGTIGWLEDPPRAGPQPTRAASDDAYD